MSFPCGTARREAILLLLFAAAAAVRCLRREERGAAGVCACLPFFDDHSLSPLWVPPVSSIAERRGRREDLEGEEGCEPSEQVYGCGGNRPFRWSNQVPLGRSCPASEVSLSDPASSGPPGPGAAPGTRRAAPGRPQRPWPPYPLLLWERGCRGADVAANSKLGPSARGSPVGPGFYPGFWSAGSPGAAGSRGPEDAEVAASSLRLFSLNRFC